MRENLLWIDCIMAPKHAALQIMGIKLFVEAKQNCKICKGLFSFIFFSTKILNFVKI